MIFNFGEAPLEYGYTAYEKAMAHVPDCFQRGRRLPGQRAPKLCLSGWALGP